MAVDLIERLPTPFGLVRSGVAPDHQRIKTVASVFEKIAANPRVRFFGNVSLGRDIEIEELLEIYDGVVLACGAATDRPLNIPGVTLREVFRRPKSWVGTMDIPIFATSLSRVIAKARLCRQW